MKAADLLGIGELAARSGAAPSALRYYESLGLIASTRTAGDRRRYRRGALRRVAVIRAAQQVGLTLDEVRAALAGIPADQAPTRAQWERISRQWRPRIDARIAELASVRDRLDLCIGCGCLSLQRCQLTNPGDRLSAEGPGAHRLFVDDPNA